MVDPEGTDLIVRRADLDDVTAIGQMLYDFNREFDEPAPHPHQLAQRIRQLLGAGDTTVLLGSRPGRLSGTAVPPCDLQRRARVLPRGAVCGPDPTCRGLGRALMEAALEHARDRGADHLDLSTKTMLGPHPLRESRLPQPRRGADGPLTYFYERELRS